MAQVVLQLSVRKRWYFPVALAAAHVGLRLGLIRRAADPAYKSGFAEAHDRAVEWLVSRAVIFKVG